MLETKPRLACDLLATNPRSCRRRTHILPELLRDHHHRASKTQNTSLPFDGLDVVLILELPLVPDSHG